MRYELPPVQEKLEIAPGAVITNACILFCNSLRHISFGDTVGRMKFLQERYEDSIDMNCRGPAPGQMHPICRLPEMSKQRIERIVRPIIRSMHETSETGIGLKCSE